MIRPRWVWLLFGMCMALAVGAMGYVSLKAVRLDERETAARQRALQEENIRLALWRMDSWLAALLARESARPYFAYRPFYAVDRPYMNMLTEIRPNELTLPSPLLNDTSPYVLVHFQIEPDGRWTSPQAPSPDWCDVAGNGFATTEGINMAFERLNAMEALAGRETLLAQLPAPEVQEIVFRRMPVRPSPVQEQQQMAMPQVQQAEGTQGIAQQQEAQAPSQVGQPAQPQSLQRSWAQQSRAGNPPNGQAAKSSVEYEMRNRATLSYQSSLNQGSNADNQLQILGCPTCPAVAEGVPRPLWVGEALLVARRVTAGGQEYVQGCRLDWAAMRVSLLEDIADLLPDADLRPARADTDARHERMLTALPVRLIPGALPAVAEQGGNPLHWSLATAWGCVVLAGLAVAALLRGAMVLSERRGAFVSAVTHELRTPLTTLRMYTEMLADGMVRDDGQRSEYFGTIRAEADRLGHLVENVLAYSRIERGRARTAIGTHTIGELIGRIRGRLGERARQAGMELAVEPDGAESLPVRADPSAVEQILFNLVDNACKYGVSARSPVIHLEAARVNGCGVLRVRDHGEGIRGGEARRLFRPFSKSARDAANSAPGVGLGLALSRRLAREMGGDLCVDTAVGEGACFLLLLPVGDGPSHDAASR